MPGTKLLLVMRHAKSSWKTHEPDVRRPLNGRGTRDAVVAGQAIAELSPDVVWCSAATRAVQTWQCATMGGASCPDVRTTEELYGASAEQLLSVVRRTPTEARTVLVIAHEPGVSELVLRLAKPSSLTSQLEEKFPTGAIAVLAHDRVWAQLDAQTARLAAFKTPHA